MAHESPPTDGRRRGWLKPIVALFLEGPSAILLVILALALGVAAILLTPREEEPQIVVPVADVFVEVPGASAQEVEQLVAAPLERHLWQLDGVEYVYSVSERGRAVVTVRFHVGEDREDSLVELRDRIDAHVDEAPPIVAGWVVKPVEIDDVPVLVLTLTSSELDDHGLRRVARELQARLDSVEDVSRVRLVGGRRSRLRVELDPAGLAARGLSPLDVERALAAADRGGRAGSFARAGRDVAVESGAPLREAADVEELVLSVPNGAPVRLGDVARVSLGPEEASSLTRLGLTETGGAERPGDLRNAVGLAIAKKRGTNAVRVTERLLERLEAVRAEVLPEGVEVLVTRDSGATADGKVDDLLFSLAFAMVSVVGLLIFSLGWREGLVVALAVPLSFALALFVNLVFGYTINRVTLFALILTLGLVVDDPITNVDNIQRHILAGAGRAREATLDAVQEVLPPVILSTLTVIVSFVPLFFITGMMGPYMGPMAVTVPITVTFSTLAALSVVPWASYQLLRRRTTGGSATDGPSPLLRRWYARLVRPFLASRALRWGLLLGVLALLGASGLLVVTERVPMKMLPFDDKDELLLVLDLDEGTPLETTDAVVRDFERYLFTVPEVEHFQSHVGTHGPIDFNGLVRHHYLREAPHQADVRVDLLGRDLREQQSHEIALRLRDDLVAIAERHGARLSIVESPPGPPVLAMIAGEVTGPPGLEYEELVEAAEVVAARLRAEPGLADVDLLAEAPRARLEFQLDREKAGLHGIDAGTVERTLALALDGRVAAQLHREREREPLDVVLRLSRADRSGVAELEALLLRGADGSLVSLGELGAFAELPHDPPVYHKNMERVVFVVAEAVGRAPGEAVLGLDAHFDREPLPDGAVVSWSGEGEWDITLRVFRDLGLAFGAALLGIYLLLVVQTSSFGLPLVIMTAIPLTAIGILPGFWLLNAVVDRPVGGYATPVFFTATAMIGMIALGGIVVRNSIVLIEFVQQSRAAGAPLREAILESGAVRMRPILLTAATTALGAWPITMDPIFSGLAWALIFGLFASTAFTLLVVPVTYYALERRAEASEALG